MAINQFRGQYPQRHRQHRHAAARPRHVGVQQPKQHGITQPHQADAAQRDPAIVVHAAKTAAKPKQMPQLGIDVPSTGPQFSQQQSGHGGGCRCQNRHELLVVDGVIRGQAHTQTHENGYGNHVCTPNRITQAMKACMPRRPPRPVNKRLLAKYTTLANKQAARLNAQPLMRASKAMKAPTYTASSSKKRLMWILFRYLAEL